MKVSVLIIAYNQERYIAQAIESALMQEMKLEYELVIGEDRSTDRTRRIVADYARRHPRKIRALLHQHNLGDTGKRNLTRTLAACRGEYVALLEGDDYWTDSNKLQRQVDYLDNHPECSMCFHDVAVLHPGETLTRWIHLRELKEIYDLKDLLIGNFVPTCAIMFRNGLLARFPDWFYQVMLADWALCILYARVGAIGYLNQIMAVHRVHSQGIWSPLDEEERYRQTIATARAIMGILQREHRPVLSRSIRAWQQKISELQSLPAERSGRTGT